MNNHQIITWSVAQYAVLLTLENLLMKIENEIEFETEVKITLSISEQIIDSKESRDLFRLSISCLCSTINTNIKTPVRIQKRLFHTNCNIIK